MDETIWCHDCAVALQERLARLPDGVAFLLADALHQAHASSTPTQAAAEFVRLAASDSASSRQVG